MPDGDFAGSGGGILGSIRELLMLDLFMQQWIGPRIRPGRMPAGTPLPYIVTGHTSSNLDSALSYANPADAVGVFSFDVWNSIIQVTTYAETYDAARIIGEHAHSILSRSQLPWDSVCVNLWPNNWNIMIDPQLSEHGKDVWQCMYRYFVRFPQQVQGGANF